MFFSSQVTIHVDCELCVSIDMHFFFFFLKFLRVKGGKLAKTLSNIHTGSDQTHVSVA